MDSSSVSVLWYRRSKPLGKVRRRVQDLRIPSSYYYDFPAVRPALDLSHNESARLAADCLLSRGLEKYHEVLEAEGEVDFLSELEKEYILENGRDGSTAGPDESHDDDCRELDSQSAGSQSATRFPTVSSDPAEADLGQSSVKDVKWTGPVQDESCVEVYFQPDCRGAGMKDMVREFIRKAKMALAIVMDSFSDVELLCDLLEASRKRNVSVHLLLDHLNLSLFVGVWQDLKLDSRNFPKLSVRSVDGRTYCAKTGRKLTGQIAESFILADWTEVLTGSYSFSWLSWQVHRSLAVLLKGSAATPFHQEFHRLYSSSKPVPGFVTFITVPRALPPYATSHAARTKNTGRAKTVCRWPWTDDGRETKAEMPVLTGPQSPDLQRGKGDEQLPHGADTQTHTRPPPLHPKPLLQPRTQQSASVEKPKHTAIGVSAQRDTKTRAEPPDQIQIQRHSETLGQTHVLYNQPQPAGLTVTTTAEKKAKVQESNPLCTATATHGQHMAVCRQSTLRKNSNPDHTSQFFVQQRNTNRPTQPSGIAAGLSAQRGQWIHSLNFKLKVEPQPDNPQLLSPSTSQQTQTKTGLQFSFTHSRGHTSGLQTKVTSLGIRGQEQPQRRCQPPHQSHPTTEAAGSKPAPATTGTQLKPPLQTDTHAPATRAKLHLQPHNSQQAAKPCPRLDWMLQSRTARPGPVARTNSFDATYGTGWKTGGQPGWRPVHSNMNASLERSRSLSDRHKAGFRAGFNP